MDPEENVSLLQAANYMELKVTEFLKDESDISKSLDKYKEAFKILRKMFLEGTKSKKHTIEVFTTRNEYRRSLKGLIGDIKNDEEIDFTVPSDLDSSSEEEGNSPKTERLKRAEARAEEVQSARQEAEARMVLMEKELTRLKAEQEGMQKQKRVSDEEEYRDAQRVKMNPVE